MDNLRSEIIDMVSTKRTRENHLNNRSEKEKETGSLYRAKARLPEPNDDQR